MWQLLFNVDLQKPVQPVIFSPFSASPFLSPFFSWLGRSHFSSYKIPIGYRRNSQLAQHQTYWNRPKKVLQKSNIKCLRLWSPSKQCDTSNHQFSAVKRYDMKTHYLLSVLDPQWLIEYNFYLKKVLFNLIKYDCGLYTVVVKLINAHTQSTHTGSPVLTHTQ